VKEEMRAYYRQGFMKMSLQTSLKTPVSISTPVQSMLLQRECSKCSSHSIDVEPDEDQKKRLNLQRRAANEAPPQEVPQIVHDVLRSPGEPLDRDARAFMEPRFGHDFSKVRVHKDAKAAESAKSVNALAYTVGQDVVFGAGQYAPGTSTGKRLLTHELVHAVQQGSRGRLQNKLTVGEHNDMFEKEADKIASLVLDGQPFTPTDTRGFRLQRQTETQEKPKEPLIPIPVFDQFDPEVIAPDIKGIPDFLKGQRVSLSKLRDVLDKARNVLPAPSSGIDYCDTLIYGYEKVKSGKFEGLCCPKSRRDRDDLCCSPRNIAPLSSRCCTREEVIVNGKCFKPQRVPVPGPTLPKQPPVPKVEPQKPGIKPEMKQSEIIDHFAVNQASLPAGASEKLDRLASQLKLYKEAKVHIDGHTDSSYTPEYNQQLSERRAQTVRDALVKRGIDASRLIVTGYGKNQLLYPEERNQEEKARNRRVNILFNVPPSQSNGETRS
jgi:outer membrane protein OmpA-like peptidoglycan-associated protein